ADQYNYAIREVHADTGDITTVAGSGVPGYGGDGSPAQAATLNAPAGVAVDAAGKLYIADAANNVIREVTVPVTIWGGTGSETLIGGEGAKRFFLPHVAPPPRTVGSAAGTPLAGNLDNTWIISGPNSGTVDGITFSGIANLVGGPNKDTFVFLPGGSLTGTITGGTGQETIDYSALGSAVNVNLATGMATDVAGGI